MNRIEFDIDVVLAPGLRLDVEENILANVNQELLKLLAMFSDNENFVIVMHGPKVK